MKRNGYSSWRPCYRQNILNMFLLYFEWQVSSLCPPIERHCHKVTSLINTRCYEDRNDGLCYWKRFPNGSLLRPDIHIHTQDDCGQPQIKVVCSQTIWGKTSEELCSFFSSVQPIQLLSLISQCHGWRSILVYSRCFYYIIRIMLKHCFGKNNNNNKKTRLVRLKAIVA